MNLNEELVAYVHGNLTPDQMVKVEQMMERSPEVREEIAALQSIRATAQAMGETPEPTGKAELLARLATEQSHQMVKPVFPWMKLMPYFGTGLGMFVLGMIWMNTSGKGDSREIQSQLAQFPGSASESASNEAAKVSAESTPMPAEAPSNLEAEASDVARTPAFDAEVESVPQNVAPARKAKRPGDEAKADRSMASQAPPAYFGQRDIIRNGDIAVEVEDAKAAMEEASKLVVAMGGFVQTDSFSRSDGSEIVANLLVKIPAEKFESCKTAIGKMGKVVRQNSSSEDVTAQIANSKGRLQSLADSEAMYIRSLSTARTSGERMEIRARLDAIRTERAGLQEEYKRLKSLADLSTLSIQFEQVKTVQPVDENSNWWSDSWTGASNAFGWVAQNVGRIGIYLLIFAPIWLPVAGYLAWKRKQR